MIGMFSGALRGFRTGIVSVIRTESALRPASCRGDEQLISRHDDMQTMDIAFIIGLILDDLTATKPSRKPGHC